MSYKHNKTKFGNKNKRKETINHKCSKCEEDNDDKEELIQISRKNSTINKQNLEISNSNEIINEEIKNVINDEGKPLDAPTKECMESKFGYELSNVIIHDNDKAAKSAASINASAYTTGSHIVFGRRQYVPSTSSGQKLIAHELVHVLQQRKTSQDADYPQENTSSDSIKQTMPHQTHNRLSTSISTATNEFIQRRSIFNSLGIIFGISEGDFTEMELLDYLNKITASNKFEDRYDSDNKARAVVRKWKTFDKNFQLLPKQKILLIQEMQSGFTGNDDEKAILDLLELSENDDLRVIFGPGGINVDDLNSDFHGEESKRLRAFYQSRFKNGEESLKKGKVQTVGFPPIRDPKQIQNWNIEDLQKRIDLISGTISRLDENDPNRKNLNDQIKLLSEELLRKKALEEGRTFDKKSIDEMKRKFMDNAKLPEKDENRICKHPKCQESCIVIFNNVLKELHKDQPLKATNETIEKAMEYYQKMKIAESERMLEFVDEHGKDATYGSREPHHFKNDISILKVLLEMAKNDIGWSVFALSIADGHHSVILTLDNNNPSNPKVYWSDQWSTKRGWKEYSADGLKKEIERITINAWKKPTKSKQRRNTMTRLWRFKRLKK